MKNYIFITVASFVMMTSCKDPQKDELVMRQRDSLLKVIDERETSVNEFIASFNELEKNLDSVSAKQHIILLNSDKLSDTKLNQKARISAEIKAINELMDSNSKQLKTLNGKLNRSDKKNAQLIKTIEVLNNQINQKNSELAELNERLNSLHAQVEQLLTFVDILSTDNMAQSQVISDKTAELLTAYYIVGHSKDLQKSNLIDKKGGLLGIGRTSKLNENLDINMFTKINYNETTSIPINSKEMKIITPHPTDSYSLDKTDKMINNLIIINPEKFWSESKYLVITN